MGGAAQNPPPKSARQSAAKQRRSPAVLGVHRVVGGEAAAVDAEELDQAFDRVDELGVLVPLRVGVAQHRDLEVHVRAGLRTVRANRGPTAHTAYTRRLAAPSSRGKGVCVCRGMCVCVCVWGVGAAGQRGCDRLLTAQKGHHLGCRDKNVDAG